ncbi:MAG: CvpA family protein [Ruminococcus sp.]
MSLALDLGVIIIVLLTVIVCFKRGFAKTVLGLLSNIISVVGAFILGTSLSDLIYSGLIKDNIIDSLSSSINSNLSTTTSTVEEQTSALPDYIQSILSLFGYSTDTVNRNIDTMVETQSNNIASAVESAIGPVITAIISFFLVIILFFILRFITARLSKLIAGVMEVPVLHTVNRILGGLVGILDGLVIVYFLTAIVIIVVPVLTGGAVSYFDFGVMAEETVLFRLFYDHNIVTGILNSIPSVF